ncbi:hypothetical protein [Rhizobium wuzhouense]|uniref:Uncharacterized protein n=1 Tax=Rhizobium wuzhouense TaxID=1986026 RepID=A0ABX5NSX7_9HYPH|nr:hypothetical protein [Rhizobium wuzhouense]PYB71401.1 hypothetical protein DMY87_18835 [Rhizobium wuzhouense]
MRTILSLFAASAVFAAPLAASAETLSFTLENKTSNMVVQVHVSPVDGGKSVELLRKKGLYGGKSRQLTIDDGTDACVYRIRVVFEGDSYYDLRDKVDFCETGSYTIAE